MNIRPRRLRNNLHIRNMVRETKISKSSIIYPIFIIEGENIKEEISSMPNQYRYSIDRLDEIMDELEAYGISNILLFGIPLHKDEVGSCAYDDDGIIQRAIRYLKGKYPDMFIITDICMCEYTDHGHCGIVENNYLVNDKTLEFLGKIALSHAKAGADMLAPSDMMDGRIGFIRDILDASGFVNVPIMSYSVKYASAFYGPFRDAAGSAPKFGDRKTYQMDYANAREGLREAKLDIMEGADILMVKPAMAYADMIYRIKEITDLPVAAYSVSGEYAMVKAGGRQGFIHEEAIIAEMTTAVFRAGADIYITYFAKEIAKMIDGGIL